MGLIAKMVHHILVLAEGRWGCVTWRNLGSHTWK